MPDTNMPALRSPRIDPATISLAEHLGHPRRWWVLGALCLSLLVVGLDGTILTVALSDISVALHASTTQLQWIVNGYALTSAALLIPAGVLGDRLGRGRVLATGLTIFLVGSTVATFCTSAGTLIAARTVMGVGAAAVFPLALSILPTVFAPGQRTRAVAIVTAAMGLGMPLGPIVGGWLLDHYWWGSTMLINLPVVGVALLAGLLVIPPSKDPAPSRPDLVGMALVVLGIATLVYGIIQGPVDGWFTLGVLGPVVLGVLLLAGFALVQTRVTDPLLDPVLLRRPLYVWPTIATALTSFVMLGLLFTVPMYLQLVRGASAMSTGFRLMPMMLALVVGAGLSSAVLPRVGLRWTVAVGVAVSGLGFAPLGRLLPDSGYPLLLIGLAAIGFGFGLAMAPATDAMLGSLPAGRESTGTALNLAVKQLGGVFGIAVLGAVLSSVYRSTLEGTTSALPPAVARATADSLAGAHAVAATMPAGSGAALRGAADAAYASGMHAVAWVCLVAALLTAAVMAKTLPDRDA